MKARPSIMSCLEKLIYLNSSSVIPLFLDFLSLDESKFHLGLIRIASTFYAWLSKFMFTIGSFDFTTLAKPFPTRSSSYLDTLTGCSVSTFYCFLGLLDSMNAVREVCY
jgi:hypothetical protein